MEKTLVSAHRQTLGNNAMFELIWAHSDRYLALWGYVHKLLVYTGLLLVQLNILGSNLLGLSFARAPNGKLRLIRNQEFSLAIINLCQ